MTARAILKDAVRPPARALRGVVRRQGLDAAAASDRAAGEGARRALDAADRADRRRQDARRLPAEPRRPPRAADGKRAVGGRGIHTLYISPLKALAVDIARNLEAPVAEIGLPVQLETRTGDTPVHKRQRQKLNPPDILLTTPEQAALLLSAPDADRFFADLDTVILDELHALVTNKRGDLLSLGLARLRSLAPSLKTIGLSATVADPDALRGWLVGQGERRDPSP